jgi:hypothetical protein
MVRVGLGNEGAVGSVLADIQGRLGEPCRMNHGNLQSLQSMRGEAAVGCRTVANQLTERGGPRRSVLI